MQCCVQGVVLEAFGAGNIPDLPAQGWMPWLRQQRKKGLQVSSVAGTPTPPDLLHASRKHPPKSYLGQNLSGTQASGTLQARSG